MSEISSKRGLKMPDLTERDHTSSTEYVVIEPTKDREEETHR
jgi:hypothetical protein